MKFHVKIFFAYCDEHSFTTAEESNITFARAYSVNGIFVLEDWAELAFCPWGELRLKRLREGDFRPSFAQEYEVFIASLAADDYLDGTTEDVVVLPVSTFEFIDKSDSSSWYDMMEPGHSVRLVEAIPDVIPETSTST